MLSWFPGWYEGCVVTIVATTVPVMKIAVPVCRNRIAPLFDVAETFVLFEDPDTEHSSTQTGTIDSARGDAARQLVDAGVGTVLCGAISLQWQNRLNRLGIEVHGFLAGEIPVIAQTYWKEGPRGLARFAMPGCQHRGQGRQRRMRRHDGFMLQQLEEEIDHAAL